MIELVSCARALVGGVEHANYAFVVENGRISAAGDCPRIKREHPANRGRSFGTSSLVVPGFINGHSHAYQILLRGWADDLTFERWRREALYRVIPQLDADDVYWVFVAAFSEMLAAGITTVAEFFYLNGRGNALARAAIRACKDVGIRLIFARTWMDAEYLPEAFRETTDVARDRTEALIEEFPEIMVCPAPHSLHACSPAMIQEASRLSRARDLPMHIHVAEARYEVQRTLAELGATPIHALAALDVLNDRLIAVHAIYVSEEEKDAIAQAGASIIHNPMTNQYLGDGICDVTGYRRRGVAVGLGTDANVNPSILEEMRAASLLQKLQACDASVTRAADGFAMGTWQGAAALRTSAGDLTVGSPADYCVIDASRIDAWSGAVNALVYRADRSWVQNTFVGGRELYVHSQESHLGERASGALIEIAAKLDLPGS
ncbi:MAG: amidohydrolase family protein [Candidatus Eremiobacteraeota bacterium]|nr:amidohydrolase family protein [Candidatus Eremiobacteraeota bacterium]